MKRGDDNVRSDGFVVDSGSKLFQKRTFDYDDADCWGINDKFTNMHVLVNLNTLSTDSRRLCLVFSNRESESKLTSF